MSINDPNNQNPEDVIHENLLEKMSLGDKVFNAVTDMVWTPPPRKPKDEVIAKLDSLQEQQLKEIQENAIAGFVGQLEELESALGMLMMGHHFGWKILYLIHSKKTIRKYEDILGVKIRDIFPERGPSSYRSFGLALADKIGNFWKVAGGDIKIPDRRKVDYEEK